MPVYKSGTPSEGGIVILTPGIYLALVTEAKQGRSGSGNDKIDLTCVFYKWDAKNNKAIKTGAKAWETLVFTEKAFWKIDQFRAATGDTGFEAGQDIEITPGWCMNRRGWVRVGNETIEEGKHAGKEKNTIETWLLDYDPREQQPPASPSGAPANADVAPDDIPF